MATFFYGFWTSLSLILAIGAQNAFVLKQGLKHQHVFVVCLICALSDSILITSGVLGLGVILDKHPLLISVAKYAGAVFLLVYGFRSLKSAFTQTHALVATGQDVTGLWQTVLTCLAFTWLNPHVYLDTVILLGSVAARADNRLLFAIGAVSASWLFFFSLGYGAKRLAPIFAKPTSWKILDGLVGVMMWVIAGVLVFGS